MTSLTLYTTRGVVLPLILLACHLAHAQLIHIPNTIQSDLPVPYDVLPVKADDLALSEIASSHPHILSSINGRSISAGGYQSSSITQDNAVFHWGLTGKSVQDVPVQLTPPHSDDEESEGRRITISTIEMGDYHSLALTQDGKLYSWGRGDNGRLGHSNDEDYSTPTLIKQLSKKKTRLVAAGFSHSIAVSSGGIYTWGEGGSGQLGQGDAVVSHTPKPIKTPHLSHKDVAQVCAGGHHTALLTHSGDVYTFGNGVYGALGHGSTKNSHVPILVGGLLAGTPVKQIACGGDHMLALTRGGAVLAWGWNEKGQLGTGDTDDRLEPVRLPLDFLEGSAVASVAAGGYATSFLVAEDGAVYAFGMGEGGSLGTGDQRDCTTPTRARMLEGLDIVTVSAGYKHTVALTRSGEVITFGDNSFGSLGVHADDHLSAHTNALSPSASVAEAR